MSSLRRSCVFPFPVATVVIMADTTREPLHACDARAHVYVRVLPAVVCARLLDKEQMGGRASALPCTAVGVS